MLIVFSADESVSLATYADPAVIATVSVTILVASLALLLFTSNWNMGKAASKPEKKIQRAISQRHPSEKRLTIIFGTQTGTAENFAKTLAQEAKSRFSSLVNVRMWDIEEYGADDDAYEKRMSSEELALFLFATYGDGEPTDSSTRFCKWLAKKVAEAEEEDGVGPTPAGDSSPSGSSLSKLRFSVFGLGNRQYEHFNMIGKAVDKQLQTLGAKQLAKLGLGDDDQCIEDDFEAWKTEALTSLESLLSSSTVGAAASQRNKPRASMDRLGSTIGTTPSYYVEMHGSGKEGQNGSTNGTSDKMDGAAVNADLEFHHDHALFRSPVHHVKELHAPSSDRSCLHVELDLSGSGLSYEPGDHVALFPRNSPSSVAAAASCLGLPLSSVFSLHKSKHSANSSRGKVNGLMQGNGDGSADQEVEEEEADEEVDSMLPDPFPCPTTLEHALSQYADLHSQPKKTALLALSHFASDQEQAERLRFLASPEGKEEFQSLFHDGHLSLLDLLLLFPSCKPPLGVFFAIICPRLQPRFYSISSAQSHVGDFVHVTCALVTDPKPGGGEHQGVCSHFLQRSAPSSTPSSPSLPPTFIPLFIRPSAFKLPADPLSPIVMIGPGTGLAPFRGFLQEREVLQGTGVSLGPAVLFFGCRNKAKDFIYESELKAFQDNGVLTSLFVAFSRDGGSKDYVQHHMLKNARLLWKLVFSHRGTLYVCGDAKAMARDVHRMLLAIAKDQECVSSTEAEALVTKLHSEGRYLRDVW